MRTTDYWPRGSIVDVRLNYDYPDGTPATHDGVQILSIDAYGVTVEERGVLYFYSHAAIRTLTRVDG